MTTQSDTPRTDALLARMNCERDQGQAFSHFKIRKNAVLDLARDLERENARMRDALSEILAELDNREPPQGHIFKDTGGMLLARAALGQ